MTRATKAGATTTLIAAMAMSISGCGGPTVVGNGGAYGSLTAAWGARLTPHTGIDYGGHLGRPIIAAADGIVTMVLKQDAQRDRTGPNGGNTVEIRHKANLPDGSRQAFTVYAHLGRIDVRSGESVKRGQKIGTMGTTGCARYRCDPHVHFKVHPEFPANPENPTKFIAGCHDPKDPPAFDRQKMLVYPVEC